VSAARSLRERERGRHSHQEQRDHDRDAQRSSLCLGSLEEPLLKQLNAFEHSTPPG
jgi:hypothetical protein